MLNELRVQKIAVIDYLDPIRRGLIRSVRIKIN